MVIGYTQVVMQKSKSKSREDKKWQKNKLVSTTTDSTLSKLKQLS